METMETVDEFGEKKLWILYTKYQKVKNELWDAKNYSIPIKDAQIMMLKTVLELHDIPAPTELTLKKEVQDGVD